MDSTQHLEKLRKYGINTPFDFVHNQGWALFNKTLNKTGFDIFEDVTSWPKLYYMMNANGNSPFWKEIYIQNISTNLIPRNKEKILRNNGRCLSYGPSPKKVGFMQLAFIVCQQFF